MPIIITLIVGIVLVLIVYGLLYYLGHRYGENIQTLDDKKQDILAIPVPDKLYQIKNKHVSGNTRRLYDTQRSKWETIKQYKLPEIESSLVSAQNQADKFSLVKARQQIDSAEELLEETEVEVREINDALSDILALEGENEAYHNKTYERYAAIRKQLLAHGYAYGEAIDMLEKHLSYVELDFTKYNALMNDGDFMGADEELHQINADIDALDKMMSQIPDALDKIENEYNEQLEDIKQGYQRLKEEEFQFPKGVNVAENIDKVAQDITNAYNAVLAGDLNEAKNLMKICESQIDHTYQLMEDEIAARDYVDKNQGKLQKQFDQVSQSNHYSQLEADRISQSYVLHDNEIGKIREFSSEIKNEQQKIDRSNEQLGARTIAYSEMKKRMEDAYRVLSSVEKGQSHIISSMSHLKSREKEMRDELYTADLELRNMQRRIERFNLPGLSDDYLDLFFETQDMVDDIEHKMNRVKLDIRTMTEIMTKIDTQLDTLSEQTEIILDHAILTENCIQYANRFRSENPEINQAIQEANHYYYDEFDYQSAYQTVSEAIDAVEPGASKHVEQWYYEDKERGNL